MPSWASDRPTNPPEYQRRSPNVADRRKPPGPKLRNKFAINRIKRRFLELAIEEKTEAMETAKTAKDALKLALERERLKAKFRKLPVRRRPLKDNPGSSSGGGAGGIFS